MIALSRVSRRDGEVVHAEAWLFSHAVVEPMLHATATLRGLGRFFQALVHDGHDVAHDLRQVEVLGRVDARRRRP